jgi:hypothetical protein
MARIFKMDSDRANRFLVTGGEDKTVRLWELPSGKALNVLRPPIGPGASGVIRAAPCLPRDHDRLRRHDRAGDGYGIYIFERERGACTGARRLKEPVLHLSFRRTAGFSPPP